jgi:hypothetical protein
LVLVIKPDDGDAFEPVASSGYSGVIRSLAVKTDGTLVAVMLSETRRYIVTVSPLDRGESATGSGSMGVFLDGTTYHGAVLSPTPLPSLSPVSNPCRDAVGATPGCSDVL